MNDTNKNKLVITKLIQETQKGSTTWRSFFDETIVLPHDGEVIDKIYVTEYKEKRFRMFRYRYKDYSAHFFTNGPVYWKSAVKLEIVDSNHRSEWEFPSDNSLDDLYETVRYKVADVNNLIDDILGEEVPINSLWKLNHWGSTCASIVDNKMIFTGTEAPKATDGSHIDLTNKLELGKTYEVSCFAKSDRDTTAMFQLWCHDQTGNASVTSPYKTPPTEGERVKVSFKAENNKNIRIHLQYQPGQGRIEISEVRLVELF